MALELENARLVSDMLTSARLQSVGTLLGGVAHQINNPITSLVASVRYVSDGLAELDRLQRLGASPRDTADVEAWWRVEGRRGLEELKGALADALESADRIRDIAKDMRALVRADVGVGMTFDLGDAVRGAMRIAGSEIQASAQVALELEEGALVQGSQGRLVQCFIHLMLNAAQAHAATGRRGRVRVAVRRAPPWVVAEIEDDGPGIRAQDLDRIFDPFFSTRMAGSGIGLGLPICREVAARHGGDLAVRSAPGQGATFTLRLPLAAGAPPTSTPPPVRGVGV
jgi:signal transduction histidine kinase